MDLLCLWRSLNDDFKIKQQHLFFFVPVLKLATFIPTDKYKVIISSVVNSCSSVLLLFLLYIMFVYVAFEYVAVLFGCHLGQVSLVK